MRVALYARFMFCLAYKFSVVYKVFHCICHSPLWFSSLKACFIVLSVIRELDCMKQREGLFGRSSKATSILQWCRCRWAVLIDGGYAMWRRVGKRLVGVIFLLLGVWCVAAGLVRWTLPSETMDFKVWTRTQRHLYLQSLQGCKSIGN